MTEMREQRRATRDASSEPTATVTVPQTFGDVGGQAPLGTLDEIAATAGDEVDVSLRRFGFEGQEAADLIIELTCYASTYDRVTRRIQRIVVRELVVVPVFALSEGGEQPPFLGYDVVDSKVDGEDLSAGYVNPLAKGVPAGTALRTLQARLGERSLPRAVERDARQRRWARAGHTTYQDTLAEVTPTTRGWWRRQAQSGRLSSAV